MELDEKPPLGTQIRRFFLGAPRDFHDRGVIHKMSLVAFMAWVGLGSDGLSSSAYGPDESFRLLHSQGDYTFLLVFLALATAVTVFVISNAYSHVIEHFPTGGGGYVVATKLLGKYAGVTSGSALLVDYVLTITVSVASGGDAIFSMLPIGWHVAKVPTELAALVVLTALNLRGVKESVTALMPIFIVFLLTHVVLIGGGLLTHVGRIPEVTHQVTTGLHQGLAAKGAWGLFLIFLSGYSRGAGTYTGIEAVSNGLQIMREPRVQTGKRTMVYLATSLAITAGGILICYLLFDVGPVAGKTMNSVLVEAFAGNWSIFGLPVGFAFVLLTLLSEGALLLVAAQTGFIDGPRVMSNMAIDSWLPRRFSSLSDRLTTKDGILMMGAAAGILMLATSGNVTALVVMYAINVFLTFSLTTAGMLRHWIKIRKPHIPWRRQALSQLLALMLCLCILTATVSEKFLEGAWLTLVITAGLIALCVAVRRHYDSIGRKVSELDAPFSSLPALDTRGGETVPGLPTAVLMVGRFGGLGIHSLLSIHHTFPGYFKNVVFASVGLIDSGAFKGADELEKLDTSVRSDLTRYVALARQLGWNADYRMATHVDPVEGLTKLCIGVAAQYPQAMFFSGKLLWKREAWFQRILHNGTAYQVERRLQWKGLPVTVLPVRLIDAQDDLPHRRKTAESVSGPSAAV